MTALSVLLQSIPGKYVACSLNLIIETTETIEITIDIIIEMEEMIIVKIITVIIITGLTIIINDH